MPGAVARETLSAVSRPIVRAIAVPPLLPTFVSRIVAHDGEPA
jgi:hypothetical protein